MSDCILWDRAINSEGYGVFRRSGKNHYAHRATWVKEHGPIPEGHHVHHTCGVRSCVNLAHLECITATDHKKHHAQRVTICPRCGGTERREIRTRPGKTICAPCERERDRNRPPRPHKRSGTLPSHNTEE